MKTYKIMSERLSFGKKNTILDETAFDGANIEALIDAGHIAPVNKNIKQESEEAKDK
jgi:hypothetical protein